MNALPPDYKKSIGSDLIIPNYITQDPLTGAVGANFTGHVKAAGLDINETTAPLGGVVPLSALIFRNPADNSVGSYVQGYNSSVQNPGTDTHLIQLVAKGSSPSSGAGIGLENDEPGDLSTIQIQANQITRVLLDSTGVSGYPQLAPGTSRQVQDYGPYSCGAMSVPAGGDVNADVTVPQAVLDAGPTGNRTIIGVPDGSGGAYEYLTIGVQQQATSPGNQLRIWFANRHASSTANFRFQFWVRVWS